MIAVVITSSTTAEATRPREDPSVQVAMIQVSRSKPERQRRTSSLFRVDGPILVGSMCRPIPDRPNFSPVPTGSILSDSALTRNTRNWTRALVENPECPLVRVNSKLPIVASLIQPRKSLFHPFVFLSSCILETPVGFERRHISSIYF